MAAAGQQLRRAAASPCAAIARTGRRVLRVQRPRLGERRCRRPLPGPGRRPPGYAASARRTPYPRFTAVGRACASSAGRVLHVVAARRRERDPVGPGDARAAAHPAPRASGSPAPAPARPCRPARPPPRQPRLVEQHQHGSFRRLLPAECRDRFMTGLRELITHLPSLPCQARPAAARDTMAMSTDRTYERAASDDQHSGLGLARILRLARAGRRRQPPGHVPRRGGRRERQRAGRTCRTEHTTSAAGERRLVAAAAPAGAVAHAVRRHRPAHRRRALGARRGTHGQRAPTRPPLPRHRHHRPPARGALAGVSSGLPRPLPHRRTAARAGARRWVNTAPHNRRTPPSRPLRSPA